MKKILSLCLILTLSLTLWGCKETKKDPADPFGIASYEWEFSHVQDETGAIIYCAKGNTDQYPNAQVLAVDCKEKDGTIQLKCEGQSWSLPYSEYTAGPKGTIYMLTTSTGDVALAQVQLSELEDGTSKYSLTVAAGTTALYFYEK